MILVGILFVIGLALLAYSFSSNQEGQNLTTIGVFHINPLVPDKEWHEQNQAKIQSHYNHANFTMIMGAIAMLSAAVVFIMVTLSKI